MRTLLFVIFLVSGPLAGQQPASSPATAKAPAKQAASTLPSQPTPAQVRKLLELLRVRDELQATLDALKGQMQGQAEQTFRDKFPNPSAGQLKSVAGIVDEAFHEISLDDLIDDLVPVYQRHLTRSDVQALVAFYGSPPGQKILREQPALIRESMEAAGKKQQKRMELVLARMELRMQQLIEQEQSKGAQGKQ